ALEQFCDVGGAQVVGRLTIDRNDHVAWMDTGAISRSSNKRGNHNHFVVSWTNLHSHAVIFAALLFAKEGIGLGIKEVGMWVENPQHAGNGAIVDRFVGADWFGVVLFHQIVNLRKRS